MEITVQKLLDDYFKGDREAAARSCGVTVAFFNNWISQKRKVMRLDNGDFALMNTKPKIFKINRSS